MRVDFVLKQNIAKCQFNATPCKQADVFLNTEGQKGG